MSGMPSANFWVNLGRYKLLKQQMADQNAGQADMLQLLGSQGNQASPPVAGMPQAPPALLPQRPVTSVGAPPPVSNQLPAPATAPVLPGVPKPVNGSPMVPPANRGVAPPPALSLRPGLQQHTAESIMNPATDPRVMAKSLLMQDPLTHLKQIAAMFYARHGNNPPVGEQAAFLNNMLNLFHGHADAQSLIAKMLPTLLADQSKKELADAANQTKKDIGQAHDSTQLQAAKIKAQAYADRTAQMKNAKQNQGEIQKVSVMVTQAQNAIQQVQVQMQDPAMSVKDRAVAMKKIQQLYDLKNELLNYKQGLYGKGSSNAAGQ